MFQMNSFDHVDSDDDQVTEMDHHHYDNGYYGGWSRHDPYGPPPGSVNSDYGETPSDMSSPMSQ